MVERTTTASQYRDLTENIRRASSSVNRALLEITSGKRILAPSDDPSAVQEIQSLKITQLRNDQFLSNIGSALDELSFVDTTIDHIELTLEEARKQAVAGLSGTTTAESREAIAKQLDSLKAQLLSLANTSFNGKFLFGGTASNSAPFTQGVGGVVSYNGNANPVFIRADEQTLVQTNVTGAELFVGPPDVFAALDSASAALRADDENQLRTALDDVSSGLSQVRLAHSAVGATISQLQNMQEALLQLDVNLQEQAARLQDVDLIEAATRLNQSQRALEAALSAGGRIIRLSLLDFLD